jgi:hypothetical protein
MEETGSLLREKGKHNPPSRVSQCAEDVRERFLRSPRKSLLRLSQETGYSLTMCQRASKQAKIRPYRVTAVQELIEPDKIKCVHYCSWFLNLVERNPGILTMAWFTDEAWFHLSGYVNSQNTRPCAFTETPLHPQKVGVWCAISAERVIGPIFFERTVNSDVYKDIFMTFVEQLLLPSCFCSSGFGCCVSVKTTAPKMQTVCFVKTLASIYESKCCQNLEE